MSAQPPKCTACDDTGRVVDALGRPRPCSRCNIDAYHQWSARNREGKKQ